jgi:hypothetical protein
MTESKPKQTEPTEPSTQPLPRTPRAEEMKTWNEEMVLRWIQQREPSVLKGDNLENFNEAGITGSAFLLASFKFFKGCKLSLRASLVLNGLVDEVKEGKFTPWT